MRHLLALALLLLLACAPSAPGAHGFTSTSTYIRCTTPVVTAAPLTMACWFNVANVTADHELMGISDTAGTSNYFAIDASGASAGDPVRAVARSSTGGVAATTTSFTASTWHHACGTFTSATLRAAYLNGGGVGTNTTSQTPAGLDNTTVGMLDRSTPLSMSGSLAECAIWNVVLSDAEIASLAAGFSPRLIRPASLVYYAPLVNNVFDWKGNTLSDVGSTVTTHPRIYRTASLRPFGWTLFDRSPMLAQWLVPLMFAH